VNIVNNWSEERRLRIRALENRVESRMVSVVIPVYNSGGFVIRTLNSVLSQAHSNIEVIVVNDGSTDNTENEVLSVIDSRVKYIYQANQGVSAARNRGLELASGDYVVFFDSDDLMEPAFVSSRVMVLEEYDLFDFSCGYVLKINLEGRVISEKYKAACIDIESEILGFREDVITCPSSYLFRTNALRSSGIRFNTALTSTADRYFLLMVGSKLKGVLLRDKDSYLLYRYRRDSMSNTLSERLINDNILFYKLVLESDIGNEINRRLFRAKSYYVLSGAYFFVGDYVLSILNAIRSFLFAPLNFVRTFFRSKSNI
jgi:glycosyltransferase involved in cell wall biosynthesis